MTLLRDLSLLWTLVHVLIIFIFFYESRFSRKKTVILTVIGMTPVAIINVLGLIFLGVEIMGQLILLTCTIPSLIYFFFIAKNRNAKFIFTFCLVDTISYEIVVLTNLLDSVFPWDNYIVMFITRIVAFPLMEWLVYKYARKPYLEFQNKVQKGWGAFAFVAAVYYVLLVLMSNFPTIISGRPEYIPAVLVACLLMPAMYLSIFFTLNEQMKLIDAKQREESLKLQTAMLTEKINQAAESENKMRIQRHDIRHRYAVISAMLQSGNTEEALSYINEANSVLDEIKTVRYCDNPVINAVFSYYCRKAQSDNIETVVSLEIPELPDINTAELSLVFANGFENAIHACNNLPEEKRYIECVSTASSKFIFEITNPYIGEIKLDKKGVPKEYGTGISSMLAFCEKYKAKVEFKTADGEFTFRMVI